MSEKEWSKKVGKNPRIIMLTINIKEFVICTQEKRKGPWTNDLSLGISI